MSDTADLAAPRRIVRRAAGDPSALPNELNPVLRRVYAARGIVCPAQLDLGLNRLARPALRGLHEAVELLEESLKAQQRIVLVGDFDADGATGCALGVRALRLLGAEHVGYLVPNRFEFGYGLTPEIVQAALQHRPHLLITVDNGIAAIEGVRAARAAGLRVLVTDHHLPGQTLPDAHAIVNPNQHGCEFPSKSLAGVGVVFYLMLALRARLRDSGWFASRGLAAPRLADLLDLVALGTVADVAMLDHNNRILVEQGLRRIRAGQCTPGIIALAAAAGRDHRQLQAADLGFAIGPRLNAAGRLEDMALGVELLVTDDPCVAVQLAQRLDGLNRARRIIERDMEVQALRALEALHLGRGALPPALCLHDPTWHPGVVGVLASRLRERTASPVIAFARDGEDRLKGSARSVPGLHIRDALNSVANRHRGLVLGFGGHSMAAGLTIYASRLPDLQQALADEVGDRLGGAARRETVLSDGLLSRAELSVETALALRVGGPWGQGFPEPVFDGLFEVSEQRLLKERHLRLRLRPVGEDIALQAIAFDVERRGGPPRRSLARVAYRLGINEYRGRSNLQLYLEHIDSNSACGEL